MKFIKLGLAESHKKLLRNIRVFKEWGLDFVKKRIKAIMKNGDEVRKKKSKDIIETLYFSENLKGQKQETFSEGEILEERSFLIFS